MSNTKLKNQKLSINSKQNLKAPEMPHPAEKEKLKLSKVSKTKICKRCTKCEEASPSIRRTLKVKDTDTSPSVGKKCGEVRKSR